MKVIEQKDKLECQNQDRRGMATIDLGLKRLKKITPSMLVWFLKHMEEFVEFEGVRAQLFSHCYLESNVSVKQIFPGIKGESGCSEGALISLKTRPDDEIWEEEIFVLVMNEHQLTMEFVRASKQLAILDNTFYKSSDGTIMHTSLSFKPDIHLFGEACSANDPKPSFYWLNRFEKAMNGLEERLPLLYDQASA